MEWHPFAERFPMLEGAEWEAFKESIKATKGPEQKVAYRVVKGKKQGLDGRNRFRACEELGIKCPLEKVNVVDEQVKDFIIRRNVHRRHLDAGFRRELVAELRAEGKSTRTIAGALGVSQSTVQRDAEQGSGEPNDSPEMSNSAEKRTTSPEKVTGQDGKEYPATKPAEPLCQSCQRAARTGQKPKPKCPDCAALRAESKDEPEQEADADGTPIPAHVLPAFANAKKFLTLNTLLNQCLDLAAEIKVGPEGKHFRADHVEQQIENCKNSVLAAKPSYVCPYCKGGEKQAKCSGCRGCGYVTKGGYANAPGGKLERKYQNQRAAK